MGRGRHRLSMVALLVAAAVGDPALADGIGNEDAPPQEICGACHGLNGISHMAKFPKLAGQKQPYLEKQIRDFREGRRSNDGGQMTAVVTEITETQIAEVAGYFAALPAPAPQAEELDAAARRRAEALFNVGDPGTGVAACRTCHRQDGAGAADRIEGPHLAAQHEDYLARQLRDFRSGARANDTSRAMQRVAEGLSDADIAALARFLAGMRRDP